MPRAGSTYDELRQQGRLWTPETDPRPPLHWLDYQTDALTMSGSAITQVTPTRGRNRNTWAAKAGGTNPTLTTRNGFRAARFDGTHEMTHIATSSSGFQDCTLMFAGYMISGGSNEDIVMGFGNANANGGGGRWMYRLPNGGTMGFACWGFDLGSSGTTWDIAGLRPHVFAARKSARNVLFDTDGSLAFSTGTFGGDPANVASAIASIGGINGSGGSNAYGTNIDVFEALWWDVALTDVEYQRAQAYLCWKYGLPIVGSSPFRHRPPVIGW